MTIYKKYTPVMDFSWLNLDFIGHLVTILINDMRFSLKIKDRIRLKKIKIKIEKISNFIEEETELKGEFSLVARRDYEVNSIKVSLLKYDTVGRGKNKLTKVFSLGHQRHDYSLRLKKGQKKKIEFKFDYKNSPVINYPSNEDSVLFKLEPPRESGFAIEVCLVIKGAKIEIKAEFEIELHHFN